MPYIFVDEVPEGADEADVVSREDYDTVAESLRDMEVQRDSAVSKGVELEGELKTVRDAYAKAFITNPVPKQEPEPIKQVSSYDELFS